MTSKNKAVPRNSDHATLSKEGTYSKQNPKGELINQGIGNLVGQAEFTVTQVQEPRTVIHESND